jgi:hypothetical protein
MSTFEYMVHAVSRWDNACRFVDWVMQCQDNAMLDREPRGMVIPHGPAARWETGPVVMKMLEPSVTVPPPSFELWTRVEVWSA